MQNILIRAITRPKSFALCALASTVNAPRTRVDSNTIRHVSFPHPLPHHIDSACSRQAVDFGRNAKDFDRVILKYKIF